MQPVRLSIATLFGLLLAAPCVQAQPCYAPIPQAPSACYPSGYAQNRCGLVYPMYCPYPPFGPFQGMVPGPPPPCAGGGGGPGGGGPLGSPVFPSHPFARGPRDYFMYYDRDRAGESPF
jgi:hypothetical protein